MLKSMVKDVVAFRRGTGITLSEDGTGFNLGTGEYAAYLFGRSLSFKLHEFNGQKVLVETRGITPVGWMMGPDNLDHAASIKLDDKGRLIYARMTPEVNPAATNYGYGTEREAGSFQAQLLTGEWPKSNATTSLLRACVLLGVHKQAGDWNRVQGVWWYYAKQTSLGVVIPEIQGIHALEAAMIRATGKMVLVTWDQECVWFKDYTNSVSSWEVLAHLLAENEIEDAIVLTGDAAMLRMAEINKLMAAEQALPEDERTAACVADYTLRMSARK